MNKSFKKLDPNPLRVIDADWKNCTRCPLGTRAYKHVLYQFLPRRQIPVDIMFIGEGPGKAEDAIGLPFRGPSGNLLRKIIKLLRQPNTSILLSNLVACIPRDKRTGPVRQPTGEEILTCRPRLKGIIEIARPKVIVALGGLPQEWVELPHGFSPEVPIFYLTHPGWQEREGGEEATNWPDYVDQFRPVFALFDPKPVAHFRRVRR